MDKKIDTVCIVDDDDIYKFIISHEIKNTNLVNNIIMFPDGSKAINYVKIEKNNSQNLPDIIFLDVNMPVMDGWQFLEEYIIIKTDLPKSIVIYMVSSSVDDRDIERANEISELSGYIVKPIGKTMLIDLLNNLLN